MKKEVAGKGSMFINRLGNVFMSAPIHLMYLSLALLGMYLLGQSVAGISFRPLDFGIVGAGFLMFYLLRAYLSLGRNYNDIIVGKDQIQMVNRIPGFRRKVTVPLHEVEEVLVAESHIDLERPRLAGILREAYHHPERKWVEIKANGRRRRWNCYGINDGIAVDGPEVSALDELVLCLRNERKLPVRVVNAVA